MTTNERDKRQSSWCSRRGFLGMSAAVGVGLTAGCIGSTQPGGGGAETKQRQDDSNNTTGVNTSSPSGPREVHEGFEDGSFTDTFTDYSQQFATLPSVTSEYAQAGNRALIAESQPGVETAVKLRMTETVSGKTEYSVFVKKISSSGAENGISLFLRDTDSRDRLRILDSQWHGGVIAQRPGDDPEQPVQQSIHPGLDDAGWTRVNLRLEGPSEVRCIVGGESVTMETRRDWTSLELKPTITTNAWGNGDAVAAAFDDYRVSPLETGED